MYLKKDCYNYSSNPAGVQCNPRLLNWGFNFANFMQDTNIESLEWEIWKDIPWWEWLYMASTMGRIKSCDRYRKNGNWYRLVKSRIILWFVEEFWYIVCTLSSPEWSRRFRVHRIMWITFLWLTTSREFIPSESFCVCHKDDNPSNNRLDNLYLWTLSDNTNDRHTRWRTKPPNNPGRRFWKDNHITKIVIQYSKDMEILWEYYGSWEAWIATWLRSANIRACCRWKVMTAWWFIWRYK